MPDTRHPTPDTRHPRSVGYIPPMSRLQPMQEITEIEKAVLVFVEPDESLRGYAREELAALTETAGATVVGEFFQRRDRPDPRYYIGPGKTDELFAGVQDAQ